MRTDLKRLKASSCLACGLHEKGNCRWFEEPKAIPVNVIDKGCKFWRSDFVQEVINRFEGELINGRYI